MNYYENNLKLLVVAVLSVAVWLPFAAAAGSEELEACVNLFDPEGLTSECCESLNDKESDAKFEECFKSESDPCAAAKCVLEKDNVIVNDKIDEERYLKVIQEDTKDNEELKQMSERVKEMCLDGQYKAYGPETLCDYVKLEVCVLLHTNSLCKTWKGGEVCTKMSKNAAECRKQIDALN